MRFFVASNGKHMILFTAKDIGKAIGHCAKRGWMYVLEAHPYTQADYDAFVGETVVDNIDVSRMPKKPCIWLNDN